MPNLGPQLINQSYQDLLQITSSNQVQKGDGTSVTTLAITSSTTTNIAPAITNNTDNRVLTATGGGTINGEANLIFDGGTLGVVGDVSVDGNITAVNTVDTTNLSVNGYVNTNLSPTDATYNLTLGESLRTWNQVHVGTSDGTRTAFFGEDLANNPGKIAIRTDNDLIIRANGGLDIQATTTIPTLQNDTLTNNVSISTPSLTATNLRATNSASIGGNFVPQARLHISGANNQALLEIDSPAVNNILFVTGSGRVGIGTSTPTTTLDVAGSINATGFVASANVFTNLVRGYRTASFGAPGIDFPTTAVVHISGANADALLRVSSATQANVLLVSGSGLIGVNRVPGVALDVTGQIRSDGTIFSSTTQTNTIQLSSATNLRFLSASVETARYDNNGWGFFNTAPAAKVHISGANADALFRVSSPTTTGLFVSGSGRVGIGTTNPRTALHVSAGDISLDGTKYIDWGSGNSRITDLGLVSGQGYPITISTFGPIAAGASNNLSEKLRLTGSGSLGLGTTNPLARLHVSGSDGNDFFRITSGSQNILNVRSGSAVWFSGTGVAPSSGFDWDIQGTGTANGGSVRFAGNGSIWAFGSVSSVNRGATGNSDMFNVTMGGTSATLIQNPMKIQFDANQSSTGGGGYTVLRVNATHATTAGTGSKLLQTWEFAGVQRSVVNITGSIGVGITTPSASVHISSSLGLAPILAITPHHPLPTTNIPTGSFMVSSSTPPKPFFWDGTTWNALY